ncbi:MAG TPA: transcriptional repressor LexA [Nevskiaceae bacterium]|nr:transcriptional repressor LexA [Nevskiaceae bacterium]
MDELTPRQAEVLRFIRQFAVQHGMAPSRADIAEAFKVTRKAAHDWLHILAKKGELTLHPGRARGVRLPPVKPMRDPTLLPLVGRVAAGPPVLSTDEVDDWLRIDPALFHPRPDYLRKVHGDSMIEMGIQDGDLLAVHAQPDADSGQVIVAKLFRDGEPEITVKKYRRRGHHVQLLPRNAALAPIDIDLTQEEFEIEGLYCGHIHRA